MPNVIVKGKPKMSQLQNRTYSNFKILAWKVVDVFFFHNFPFSFSLPLIQILQLVRSHREIIYYSSSSSLPHPPLHPQGA